MHALSIVLPNYQLTYLAVYLLNADSDELISQNFIYKSTLSSRFQYTNVQFSYQSTILKTQSYHPADSPISQPTYNVY